MKNTILQICLSTLVLAFAQTVSQAQTTIFSYQGNLTVSGAPANGNFDFEFRLFAGPSSGTQFGPTEARNNVSVENGIISVSLNFGGTDIFAGGSTFLEVRVRPAGQGAFTTLSPREQVKSAPYSLRSAISNTSALATNAQQLGGLPASQYQLVDAPAINAGTQFNINNQR